MSTSSVDTRTTILGDVPGFLDAYLRYAIDRIEEREQLLKTAETNGWKL